MSNKQIQNRLSRLFDGIDEDQQIVEQPKREETKPARQRRPAVSSVSVTPVNSESLTVPLSPTTETTVTVGEEGAPTTLALDFRGTEQDWSRLQIIDQNPGRTWTDNDQMLVRQVVDQLTLALQNANLFQQTQRQNSELAVLNELGREISSQFNVDQLAESIYRYTSQLMDTRNFFVALTDAVRDEIRFPVLYDEGERLDVPGRKVGRGLTDWIIRNKQPLLLNGDVSARMGDLGLQLMTIGNAAPAKSWLGVPLLIGTRVLGALVVQSTSTAHLYQERQRDLLLAIAGQSAIALQNAMFFEQTQQQNSELAVLNELGHELASQLEVEEIAETVHRYTSQLMDTHNFFIALTDTERGGIRFPVLYDEGQRLDVAGRELGQGLSDWVIHNQRPLLLNGDVPGQIRELGLSLITVGTDRPPQSWLGVPLLVGATVLGAVVVQSTTSAFMYQEHQQDLLVAIAGQAAIAIQNARLFEETQAKEENFRNLVENAPEAIVVINADSLRFADPNTNAENLYGLPKDELIKLTPLQLAPEKQLDGRASADVARENLEAALRGEVTSFEWDLRNSAGEIIPTELRLSRLPGAGQLVRATLTDITVRKAAQQALRRQNEYLETAAEVGRLVTSTLDLQTLFSRTVELVRSSFKFYHASIFTLDEATLNAVLREATGEAGEEMKRRSHSLPVGSRSIIGQVTANGHTIVVNNTAVDPVFRANPLLPDTRAEAGLPLRLGTRIIGALDIQATEVDAFKPEDIAVLEILCDQVAVAIENARSYDLSQQAIEELRQLDQIKTQFLANMSHELRTPLNSIIGFSRVILKGIDGAINEQQQQDLSAIYSSGQHLLGLINDILDLAKIEAGKMELAFEEVNAADTIHGVMSTAMGLVKDKPIRLRDEIEPDLPAIRADPMRLRQILINLLSNASKFTEQGEILIKAGVQTNSLGVEEVLISVTDSGPGISPEDQEKLFKAFSQVDTTPTRKSGGTGLGLSICQHLVDLHQGRIGVHSAVGKGSTFYFTVPLFRQRAGGSPARGSRVVMCIDDDSQVIKLYERYLIPEGYQVEALTNPETARETAKRIRPFAITLDIMMPGYDGWQVITELKGDPETRDIPIIICSIVEEEEKGFSFGAADYLLKPILEDDLVYALNRLNRDGSISEVLVIDDDPRDLRLVEKILSERSQFRTVLAKGGQKGWERLQAHRPDAIILDLFMPDLDGFTILERLHSTPELGDIPVVVISGVDLNPEQKGQLENLGKRMLQKGMLDERELFSSLDHALRRLERK